jgi:hypothetical protein
VISCVEPSYLSWLPLEFVAPSHEFLSTLDQYHEVRTW